MKTNLLRALSVSTLLLAGATFYSGCDEDTGLVIGIPQTQEVIYRIDPFTGTELVRVDTVTSSLDSALATQGATREDIEGIDLTNLSLAVTDSNGTLIPTANFNNVKSINIEAALLSGTFGVIGVWDSAAMATSYQNMNPIVEGNISTGNPFDLLGYLSQPTFRVQLNGKLYNSITSTVYLKSTMTLNIRVKL